MVNHGMSIDARHVMLLADLMTFKVEFCSYRGLDHLEFRELSAQRFSHLSLRLNPPLPKKESLAIVWYTTMQLYYVVQCLLKAKVHDRHQPMLIENPL
jgi:hypothetical protein